MNYQYYWLRSPKMFANGSYKFLAGNFIRFIINPLYCLFFAIRFIFTLTARLNL